MSEWKADDRPTYVPHVGEAVFYRKAEREVRDDAEARARALAKPPRVLEPWDPFEARSSFSFRLGDWEEGGTGGWMVLIATPNLKHEVWLPIEAQQSRFLVFFDSPALPHEDQREVSRFLIGGQHRVRVGADRRNGDVYVALPTAPEALEFINWVRWQTWPEWVEAQQAAGYEVKAFTPEVWDVWGAGDEELRRRGWDTGAFRDAMTNTIYLRRKKVAW